MSSSWVRSTQEARGGGGRHVGRRSPLQLRHPREVVAAARWPTSEPPDEEWVAGGAALSGRDGAGGSRGVLASGIPRDGTPPNNAE